ncbi:hypothetical protein [Spirulina sp. 06S082]|uniref:hypothetical protein n=1 Tax=Spirulina sp. 06S082 TaxID=3110248 RepID=UPI002B1F4832|nr:hypothetical protein [Spirulina sp. 06S082]MEA5469788.1 hypothetical protein [Spirulina sp. 06S082]
MRDIYICDVQGNLLKELGYCGLPEQIWLATYQYITEQHQHEFQILAQLWQYYYGQEGDALLSPIEVALLLKDIEYLKSLLSNIKVTEIEAEPIEIQEIQKFFEDLLNLCQKAQNSDRALKFVAD